MGASGGGGQSSKEKTRSFTRFPGEFVTDVGSVIGRPIQFEEILAGLGQPRGLFGGGGGSFYNPPPQAAPAGSLPGGAVGELFRGSGTAGAGAYPGDRSFTPGQNPGTMGADTRSSRTNTNIMTGGMNEILPWDLLTGLPQTSLPPDQSPWGFVPDWLTEDRRRIASSNAGPGFDARAGAQNLGFGQAPREYAAPVIDQAQQIVSPEVQAAAAAAARARGAQADIFGGEGPQRYEQNIFESLFRPVQRELTRESELANRQLQANLAGAGIASSGTGIGQQQQQAREYSQRTQDAATDASAQAATARYEAQAQQEMLNAQMRQQTGLSNADRQQQVNLANAERQQQTRLTNANFSFEAQKQNAANVLTGNMANAENYLKTIGLNEATATQARGDFLQLLGVQEQDLARMDKYTLDAMQMAINTYLQQMGIFADAGRMTTGDSASARNPEVSFGI